MIADIFQERLPVPNEFVVDNDDLDAVLEVLGQVNKVDRDDVLGLALITVGDAEKASAAVQARADQDRTKLTGVPADLQPGVETLIGYLRGYFKGKLGWEPTLGKNRMVRGVQLLPYPSAGGSDIRDAGADAGFVMGPSDRGRGVRVGILDTPIYRHEQLAG